MQNRTVCFVLVMTGLCSCPAFSQDLSFKSVGKNAFAFDTGVVKGELRAAEKSQGIPACVDVKTGTEIAAGGGLPGLLSYYRIFSTNKRYGDAARDWPKSAALLPDGAVAVKWPPADDHPVEMSAIYRWASPNTLDLETIVTPKVEMKDFEVFLSSYFNKGFRSLVYAKAPFHLPGKPSFVAADVNPLVVGTYLAFPRDRRAAQIIYDGRWDYPPNPVQFSVTQMFAAPLCVRRDAKRDIAVLLMARPDDCFAIATPYNMDPPDGVAGHYSLYLSLFGKDLKAGETAAARVRMVVGRSVTDQNAVALYDEFLKQVGKSN